MQLLIDAKAHAKIRHWMTKAAKYEVSGLGNVQYDDKQKLFTVTDVWLQEQTNTGASTDISADGVTQLMSMHAGLKTAGKIHGDLRFWWHSHADMGVFWSNTDETAIHELSEHGWFLSSVFNHKGEIKTCWRMQKPWDVRIDDMPTSIDVTHAKPEVIALLDELYEHGYYPDAMLYSPTEETIKEWDEEYDAHVKKRTIPMYPSYGAGQSSKVGKSQTYMTPMSGAVDDGIGGNTSDSDDKIRQDAYTKAIAIAADWSNYNTAQRDLADLTCDLVYEDLTEEEVIATLNEGCHIYTQLNNKQVRELAQYLYPEYPKAFDSSNWVRL